MEADGCAAPAGVPHRLTIEAGGVTFIADFQLSGNVRIQRQPDGIAVTVLPGDIREHARLWAWSPDSMPGKVWGTLDKWMNQPAGHA